MTLFDAHLHINRAPGDDRMGRRPLAFGVLPGRGGADCAGAPAGGLPAIGIDHLGLERAALPALLRLVKRGAWVKASGPGRLDFDPAVTIRAIARANPAALLFGMLFTPD